MADVRTIKKYVALVKKKNKAEADITSAKAEMEKLQPEIVDYFTRHGKTSDSIDGITISLRRELWPGRPDDVTNEEACAALESCGLGEHAGPRINVQGLRSLISENDDPGDNYPGQSFFLAYPGLEGKIKVTETFKLGTRKAPKSKVRKKT